MSIFSLIAIILTLAVATAYINHRFIHLQTTIAMMSGALFVSCALLVLDHMGLHQFMTPIIHTIQGISFGQLLINGILSFLLFAGALTIDTSLLKKIGPEIAILTLITTFLSTCLIGLSTFYILQWCHAPIPWLYCFLFGAIITPTDPIAVLATFKDVKAPKIVETCVAGESLFNDGVAIVLFLTLYQLTFSNTGAITATAVITLFLKQAIGGIAYGLLLGYFARWLAHPITDHTMIILMTLAIVTGGYSLALYLDVSGPLAMVVAGLVINQPWLSETKSELPQAIHTFWEVIDEVLNVILFFLMGFELLAIHAQNREWLIGLLFIPVILLIRLITVALPLRTFRLHNRHTRYLIPILVWGGLRGGLAVALALSLPPSPTRELLLTLTYTMVTFAIIVQGMTVRPLALKATIEHNNP